MKFSIKRVTAITASSMLAALLCVSAARAQDADESGTDAAAPTAAQIAGTWTGTDTEGSTTGPMTMYLTQNQKKVRGTFSITTEGNNGGTGTVNGNVRGRVSQDQVTLHFIPTSGDNHNCTAKGMATVSGSTMEGAFVVVGSSRHCKGKGTFDLTM